MATTDSGQPASPGQGTTDWSNASTQGSGDRRPAGQGGGIAQMVRDTTYQRLGDQKERATETLGTVAGAVRGMTQQLRDSGNPAIADYATRAADGIERWASQLREQDIASALRGVRQFARREPALFIGVAFGAGLLAARLLKSSSNDQSSDGGMRQFSSGRQGNWDNPTSGGYGTTSGGYGTTSTTDIPRVSSDIRPAGEVL